MISQSQVDGDNFVFKTFEAAFLCLEVYSWEAWRKSERSFSVNLGFSLLSKVLKFETQTELFWLYVGDKGIYSFINNIASLPQVWESSFICL